MNQPRQPDRPFPTGNHPPPTGAGRILGTHLILDLGRCNPDVTGNPAILVAYVRKLCQHIGMTPHGQPGIEPRQPFHFGEGDLGGWTIIQPITTSTIVVHAFDADHSACVDIFSCAPYDTAVVTDFTVSLFGAESVVARELVRRVPE